MTTHPAFAQIVARRVNGSAALYGSDFRHKAYIAIQIQKSELHRDLNRNRHCAQGEIIEVALSESQWATFVSSANIGDGVPCTIQRLESKPVPGLPTPESRTGQFADEMGEHLRDAVGQLREAIAKIETMNLLKRKAEDLTRTFERLLTTLRADTPFIAEQFDSHMEKTVEAAKQEVHGPTAAPTCKTKDSTGDAAQSSGCASFGRQRRPNCRFADLLPSQHFQRCSGLCAKSG